MLVTSLITRHLALTSTSYHHLCHLHCQNLTVILQIIFPRTVTALHTMARRSQAQADVDAALGTPAKKPKLEPEEPVPGANTSGSSQPSFATLVALRHAELWFSDGNLIIDAVGISFRVYAGILERHSPVFRQLLNGLQSEDGSAKAVDGCRLLRVADKGADLAEMFSVLYDGGKGCVVTFWHVIPFTDPLSS